MITRLTRKSYIYLVLQIVCTVVYTVEQLSGGLVEYIPTAIPKPPSNVSLTQVFSTSSTIQWETAISDHVTTFKLAISSSQENVNRNEQQTPLYNVTHVIAADTSERMHTYSVKDLRPLTEYQVHIVAVNTEGCSNASNVLLFRTTAVYGREKRPTLEISLGELLVVGFVLSVWFAAIGLFLNNWGKIRISGPAGPRFKHSPKNIDTVTVVKKPKESVIYKTYRKDSLYIRTMDARMKRLERINTMPNIKVDTSPKAKEKGKTRSFFSFKESPRFERNKSEPLIELDMIFKKDKDRGTKERYQPPAPVIEVEEVVIPSVGYLII